MAFDLSSAYGNVGLSLGYPNTVTSTCAVLSPFSKLVVAFMCMHGYCMGIFPAHCAAMELPVGAEGPMVGAEAEPVNKSADQKYLDAIAANLDALTPAQLLALCHSALADPLAAVLYTPFIMSTFSNAFLFFNITLSS